MSLLLTIALPTYNRAKLLDNQLRWVANVVKGNEAKCEVLISDNCSTDDTQRVIETWAPSFANCEFTVNKQPKNVGAIQNIHYCITNAKGKYVWTISDDDTIRDNALEFVISTLEQESDLSVLILNFSNQNVKTGKVYFDHCFDLPTEKSWIVDNGKEIFERFLDTPNWGGLALTTALIYRTKTACDAFASWESGLKNLTIQLYVTSYCAVKGKTCITKENFLVCNSGTHFFLSDKDLYLSFRYAEVPESFIKIKQIGFDPMICRNRILEQRKEFKKNFLKQSFKRNPLLTISVMLRYAKSVLTATLWHTTSAQNFKKIEYELKT